MGEKRRERGKSEVGIGERGESRYQREKGREEERGGSSDAPILIPVLVSALNQ